MIPSLDAFTTPMCLQAPERLTRDSAWKQHIPFAMNLVEAIAPSVVVELGTHMGDSYCAMCQAVSIAGLDTRCYAVDTWRGDPHSGGYGPEVLAGLRAHHDPRYGGFSRLVQSTFSEALAQFGDGSIDLLHIDGFHTYNAVQQDLEGWLPKMSPAGVVLLHDTNVRERDFGVWRLWAEVRERYPHFEFVHGHGLGVLAVGERPPERLVPLLRAPVEEVAIIRRFFYELGSRVEDAFELRARDGALATALGEGERTRAELERTRAELTHSQVEVTRLEGELSNAERASEASRAELARAQASIAERDARIADMTATRAWRAAERWWRLRDGLLGRR
jgi:O-antigen biosynthesis protein